MNKTFICHSDFFGLYNLYKNRFNDKELITVFKDILEEIGVEKIYISTFNYDFLKIGKTEYGAKSQLNLITKIFQKQKKIKHTFDPVFSFCTNDTEYKFKLKKNFDSFGKDSLYNFAEKKNYEYLNLGTRDDFISTAIHYAEKFFEVKYRYKKIFKGIYNYKGKKNLITYNHRVWPKTKNYCMYDAKKINKEMIQSGVWKVLKKKNGFYIKKARIADFNEFLIDKIKNDPFYTVHKKTKKWIKEFLKDNKKITLNYFEDESRYMKKLSKLI